tara:strand:- start:509 stop:1627 length:1119 start_codon:yes stop_codon:yes gene_type:complete
MILGVLLLFLYIRLFFLYSVSWRKEILPEKKNTSDFISVVIACRNEEENISEIIQCIKNQSISKNRIELIIVNDHSNDNTLQKLQFEKEDCSFLKIINLKEKHFGKKSAIRKGVKAAKGKVILCTDADCRMRNNWIQTILDYFTIQECKFISAPVVYSKSESLFSKYQELELLSLVSSAGSAINKKSPILCNGANIAFKRKEYLEIPDDELERFATDDISLLHYFKKKFKDSIFFAKEKEAVVTTLKCKNIFSYFSQKIRWISSSKKVSDRDTILISLLVYFVNCLLLICSIIVLCLLVSLSQVNTMFLFCISIYLLKVVTDFCFLFYSLNFFSRRDLLIYLFPFVLINSIITVVIVPLSLLIPVKWKGRKI